MLAHPDPSVKTKKEENIFKHAWHSVEEALHLNSTPPEDVPPPVPPKDEKWLVKTIDKSVPQGKQPDPSFWDKLLHRSHSSQQTENVHDEAVSINVPVDAALEYLGVQSDDSDLLEKKNYFKRMAARVKEKFDEDDDDSDSDSEDESKGNTKTDQEKLENRQRKRLAPKVDPKEMKEAHQAIYGETSTNNKADEEAEKKMFGSWWGCHPRRSRAERKLAKQQEAEREQQRVLAELAAKRKAEQEAAEAAEAAARAARRKWWQLKAPESAEQKAKEKEKKERKSSSRKHQAIASAAAYEAMKKYQEHRAKEGKVDSHAEMKAVLAGMAMAECVRLFESRHDDDDDDDDDSKDDTVAEAGSKILKLFELLN
ncbi:hypothetical protein BGX27_003608 [Mortierella sp. AM989]|nr:hypothetical protein BGX27_003608 [Mortierella sp. AM989]